MFCTMSEFPGFSNVGNKRRHDGKKRVKRRKVSPEELLHEDPEIVPKYRNYLQFLNDRELGATAGVQAINGFYQMKTSHKEKMASSILKMPFIYKSCEVNFINGDDKSIFGTWILDDGPENEDHILGRLHYDMYNKGTFRAERYKRSWEITDLCTTPTGFVVVVKYPPANTSSYVYMNGGRISLTACPPPWNCGCYLPRHNEAAIGGDGYVIFIGSRGNYHVSRSHGKVCTLSHHEPSAVTLLGLHTGEISISDPRIDKYLYSIKVSDNAVNDSVFLNDHEVIVTDVESKLVKVDLRTRQTSAMFFGHKHSVTKAPFSVANDFLCATGVDNVVRIWNISGGYPIHVQKPTSVFKVRGWLTSDANKTYLHYFEKDTRTVYTI